MARGAALDEEPKAIGAAVSGPFAPVGAVVGVVVGGVIGGLVGHYLGEAEGDVTNNRIVDPLSGV